MSTSGKTETEASPALARETPGPGDTAEISAAAEGLGVRVDAQSASTGPHVELAAAASSSDESAAHSAAAPAARRWSRSLAQVVESFSGSLLVHAAVLLALALWTIAMPAQNNNDLLQVLQRAPEAANERLEEQIVAAESITLTPAAAGTLSQASHSQPLAANVGAEPKFDRQLAEALDRPQVALADVSLQAMPGRQLNEDLAAEAPGDPSAPVAGYAAAMDRMTQELLVMMAKNKVLTVWLFDQSESMRNDQQEIRQRLERVYQELGISTDAKAETLLTSVASFGAKYQLHTRRPTADFAAIGQAFDEIPVDETGEEQMCQAILAMIQQHRKYTQGGRRQVAIIVVSDESGDDGEMLETTIAAAKESGCRIYMLGREAVFGYPLAHVTYRDPGTGYEYWIPIRRGPETPQVELLQTDAFWPRRDAHPSGFGPYEQVRLCRETGGVFYLLPSLEANLLGGEKRLYDMEAMRPYLPDLSSREAYAAERNASPLRAAVAELIDILDPKHNKDILFEEQLPIDSAQFIEVVRTEQQKGQAYLNFLRQAEKRLEEFARYRREEPSPRWQANFDLLLGQTIAYQVRVYEYAAYMEQFLREPKLIKDPKTNRWRVSLLPRAITGEETAAYRQRASDLFRRIIQDHPGTPFAARAQWELDRGYGIELVEHWHPADYGDVKLPKL